MQTESSRRFVELLTGDPDAPLHWRIIHDSNKSADAINRFGTISQLQDEFHSLQREGYSPFAIINEGGHRDADITAVRAVFVDADDVPLPDSWHAPPAFLVRRDDTHWHCYWIVSDLPVARFREVQRRLAAHYGTDRSVVNPSRVMRAPGFLHLKNPKAPVAVELVDMTGGAERWEIVLTQDQLTAGLPELPDDPPPEDRPANGKPVSADIVESMLRHVSPDCDRNAWIKIAAGIKFAPVSDPDFDGLDLFTRWSAGELTEAGKPPNYKGPKDCAKTWSDLRADKHGGAGFGSLVQIAIAGGYRGPVDSLFDAYDLPPDDAPAPADDKPASKWASLIYQGEAIFRAVEPVEYFISEFMPGHGFGGNLAVRGTGKSIVGLDLLLRAASDMDWHGTPMLPGFYAVAFVGEDPEGLVLNLRAWREKHGKGHTPERFLFVPAVPDLLNRPDCEQAARCIRERIGPDARAVAMLDTWQRATASGSQNADDDMQSATANAEMIARTLRGPLLCNWHPPKSNPETVMGSGVIENASSFIWNTSRQTGGHIRLEVTRIKGPGTGNHATFEFESIGLGQDDSFGHERCGLIPSRVGGIVVQDMAKLKRQAWAERIREVVRDAMTEGSKAGPLSANELCDKLGGRSYEVSGREERFPKGGQFRSEIVAMFDRRPWEYDDGARLEYSRENARMGKFRIIGGR